MNGYWMWSMNQRLSTMPDWRIHLCLMMASIFALSCGGSDELGSTITNSNNAAANSEIDNNNTLAEQTPEDATFIAEPAIVNTVVLTPTPILAGQPINIDCQVFDANGDRYYFGNEQPVVEILHGPLSSFERRSDEALVATRTGEISLRCSLPELGLLSAQPTIVQVQPNSPHSVVTHIDRHVIKAGESVEALCDVYDAFGNPIDDAEPELRTDVSGYGIDIDSLTATMTQTGIYALSCVIDGVDTAVTQYVEVRPALPAYFNIARIPAQRVYGIGQVITVETTVIDAYDNPIPGAIVDLQSVPEGSRFGERRFRFFEDGIYEITARVEGPTHNDTELEASIKVSVNGHGPAINCLYPADGSAIHATPGTSLTVHGNVNDFHNISTASLNGAALDILPTGEFYHDIEVQFGINLIDIVASDNFGVDNVRTCAFLAADNWAGPSTFIDNSVNLRLSQNAVDDNTPPSPIQSLNDALLLALNSDGMRTALHDGLSAANPLKPLSCDQEVCVLGGCSCVVETSVTYLNSAVNGPNQTSLTLVYDGLRPKAIVRNLGIQARVTWWVPIIGTSVSTGWANVDYVVVDLTSNLGLENGLPRVDLRQINEVDVGTISLNFSGFTGVVIDIVEFLFQNTIRNLVSDTIRDYVESSFNELLDGLLSGLDISTIGSSFEVPRLDGQGHVNINFSAQFSSLSTDPNRMLFGLGTKMNTRTLASNLPNFDIPLPSTPPFLEPTSQSSVSASIYAGILNQALHTLWRGQLFSTTIDASGGNDLQQGAKVSINALLPPVVRFISNSEIELTLGGLQLGVTIPGIFDSPLQVMLGAAAQTGVSIQGDTLNFHDIEITNLYFSPDNIQLNEATRDVLQTFLQTFVQNLINSTLNESLPALPIPSFVIPDTLQSFGLPPNAELGLQNPSINTINDHLLLHSDFGVR